MPNYAIFVARLWGIKNYTEFSLLCNHDTGALYTLPPLQTNFIFGEAKLAKSNVCIFHNKHCSASLSLP